MELAEDMSWLSQLITKTLFCLSKIYCGSVFTPISKSPLPTLHLRNFFSTMWNSEAFARSPENFHHPGLFSFSTKKKRGKIKDSFTITVWSERTLRTFWRHLKKFRSLPGPDDLPPPPLPTFRVRFTFLRFVERGGGNATFQPVLQKLPLFVLYKGHRCLVACCGAQHT